MASLAWDGDCARIQFVTPDGRKTVRLGVVSERTAERVKAHIEDIADAKRFALQLDTATTAWLAEIDDEFHSRLAAVGLVQARRRATLKDFLTAYIAGREDVSILTRRNMDMESGWLLKHFGDRPLIDITPEAALEFRDALSRPGFTRPYAPVFAKATIGRAIKRARQFFKAAMKQNLVDENPFADVPAPSQVNQVRTQFIDRPTIARVMSATRNPRWHALIALSRFGGLRCPSESVALQWKDIDFKRGRFIVREAKTGQRTVPLFSEVKDALSKLERAGEWVIGGTPNGFHNRLLRLVERAGLEPWPRLWHNLRASRETELAAEFGISVAARWIGNSELIAHNHYLSVREEDYRKAVG